MIQLQYLNYILQKKDASLISFYNFNADNFSDYKKEFYFIQSHISQYGTVPDRETFLQKFPEFDIFDVSENVDFLVGEMQEDYNKRHLIKTFNNIRDALTQGDTKKALKIYQESMTGIKHERARCVDVLKDSSRYDTFVDRTTDFSKFYVKTGLDELDMVIGGWDRQEELATIMARPGTGKTWLLLKVALSAAQQGLTVGLYSGEMSANKVGYRLDTLYSHISNTKLIHGNSTVQVQYKQSLDMMATDIKGAIKVLTPDMINGIAGVSALNSFIENEKLDMLCIDQHSLLEDDRGAKNPVERASNISKDLKALQVLKKIPIIAVSQQNRSSTEEGISLTNVAQADRIGQDSTIVLALEQKDEVFTITLVKSRDTVNGKKLSYNVDLDKGIFTFIPTATDATGGKMCEDLKNEYEEEEAPF